jgi:hypothetical protein
LRSFLLFLFVVAWPAAAQTTSEAESHILGAFTSGTDPAIIAADVKLGPRLRAELGSRAASARIYDALVDRTTGNLIRVNPLTTEEAARHAALAGSGSDPLLTLESGGVTLLLRYAPARRQVSFVEQIAVAPPPLKPAPEPTHVEAPQLPPQPPKPAAVLEKPLSASPSVLAKPKPAAVAEKPLSPSPSVVEKPKPAVPAVRVLEKPQPAKPRGECVIKPVMSDEDLYNCGALR